MKGAWAGVEGAPVLVSIQCGLRTPALVRNSLCGYFLSYLWALPGPHGAGSGWGWEINSNLFQLCHPSLIMPNFLPNREHLIFYVICLARWLWRWMATRSSTLCLENPCGRRRLVQATVHGVAELDTPERFHFKNPVYKVLSGLIELTCFAYSACSAIMPLLFCHAGESQ